MKIELIILFLSMMLLISCTPSSSTGKKPEFYYKNAKVIELCNAISRNDEAAVDELLKQGVDINATGKEGMTPLWWAFSLNSISRFEMVLKKGGNPNIRTQLEYGPSVMTFAVRHKDVDYLRLALEYGGNPNYQDSDYDTLLFDAIRYDNSLKKVELLYNAGADLNHRNYMGNSYIEMAFDSSKYDIIYFFLENGADYSAPMGNYTIADFCALAYQQSDKNYRLYPYLLKIIDFLESRGVKIDLKTPFKVKPTPLREDPESYFKPFKEKSKQKVFEHNGSKPTIYDPVYTE